METLKNIVMPWRLRSARQLTTMTKGTEGAVGKQHGGGAIAATFMLLIMVVFGGGAAFLCWRCNANEDLGLRVIYTIISFIYGIPYLIYYLIIRVLLKAPCKCCGAL